MPRIHKFVGLALVLALLAAPATASALAACSKAQGTPQHCGPDCPMMTAMKTAHPCASADRLNNSKPCCEITSLPSGPSQVRAPAGAAAVVTPPQTADAVVVIAANTETYTASPPLPIASPQAVLCTFLI